MVIPVTVKIKLMEALEPLSDFFSSIENDCRISITHIGIYAALLQYWKEHQYANPFQVFSYEIMEKAKASLRLLQFLKFYFYSLSNFTKIYFATLVTFV